MHSKDARRGPIVQFEDYVHNEYFNGAEGIYIYENTPEGPKEWGCYIDDILVDFAHVIAGRRIWTYWKRFRERKREKSACVIQTAWKHWLSKKNERFNPHTFVGIVDMFMKFRELDP